MSEQAPSLANPKPPLLQLSCQVCSVLSTKDDISSAFDCSVGSTPGVLQDDPYNQHFELLLRKMHFSSDATTQQEAGKVHTVAEQQGEMM